jgi:chromosome partitioning protein
LTFAIISIEFDVSTGGQQMIVTIGAEKGGVGKSRLATHVAALAAYSSAEVILLDTDAQGSATSWTRIRNEAGHEPSISVLSLPPQPARELVNLSGKYDLIVVDIGAQNYKTMMDCALLSDLVLVPCGADQQEAESALQVFDDLKRMGHKHEKGEIPAYVVLTRVSPSRGHKATLDLREMFKTEGIPVFSSQIAHRTAWLATGKSGLALHELKGRERSEKAVDEMQAVYDEIQRKLSGPSARGSKAVKKGKI